MVEENLIMWKPGDIPIAVIMISLNESHNMKGVCENLKGWAQEVFLVDSYSKDDTVEIALSYGVHVVQRKFKDFGDQWNFAVEELPIKSPWTMKLDPDERLTNELKENIACIIAKNHADGISFDRRLWFMNRPLSVRQNIIRAWRTGRCMFTNVSVNEHPIVEGEVVNVEGELEHHDSPDLDHWLEKQNRYTTSEAIIAYKKLPLAAEPKLFGSQLQRRMWFKRNLNKIPFRYTLIFYYYWLIKRAFFSGWVGYCWARLRSDVFRFREYKRKEMETTCSMPTKRLYGPGEPDKRVKQY